MTLGEKQGQHFANKNLCMKTVSASDCNIRDHELTWRVGGASVAVAVGCRHGLIAQALLRASVVVEVVCCLFVSSVALVPAS